MMDNHERIKILQSQDSLISSVKGASILWKYSLKSSSSLEYFSRYSNTAGLGDIETSTSQFHL